MEGKFDWYWKSSYSENLTLQDLVNIYGADAIVDTVQIRTSDAIKELCKKTPIGVGLMEEMTNIVFPGAKFEFEEDDKSRIHGFIRWSGFKGLSLKDRRIIFQNSIMNPLEHHYFRIGLVHLLAPRERL